MRKFSKAHTQVAAPGADDEMTTQRERVEEKGVRLSAAAAVQVLACGVQQRVCGVHHGWIAGVCVVVSCGLQLRNTHLF
jgi:hypothetical protein